MAKLIVALCLVLLPSAFAWKKSCPTPPVQEQLDLQRYLGVWHEIERNYNPGEAKGSYCTKTNITSTGDNGVHWHTTWKFGKLGLPGALKVVGKYDSENQSAKLKIKPIPFFPSQDYWVLKTDYDNFSVVWSCAEFLFDHYQLIWVFSREPTLRPEHRVAAYQVLADNGLDLKDLIVVNHCNCD